MLIGRVVQRCRRKVAACERAVVAAADENYHTCPSAVRTALVALWKAQGALSMAEQLVSDRKKAKAGANAPASTRRGASRAKPLTTGDAHER